MSRSSLHTVYTMEAMLCKFLVNLSESSQVVHYVFDNVLVSNANFATNQQYKTR